MKITVTNSQRVLPIARQGVLRLVRFFLRRARRLNPQAPWGAVSVVIADDRLMRKLNQHFLKKSDATDVMAFRYQRLPLQTPDHVTVELVVNAERACQFSRGKRRWPATRELALYLAHACDHLAGENDATPRQRQRMRHRELRWLGEAERRGLLTLGRVTDSRPSRRGPTRRWSCP